MKIRLGTRIGQKTLEEESEQHQNTKENSVSNSPFGTFGVLNWHLLGFGPTTFG